MQSERERKGGREGMRETGKAREIERVSDGECERARERERGEGIIEYLLGTLQCRVHASSVHGSVKDKMIPTFKYHLCVPTCLCVCLRVCVCVCACATQTLTLTLTDHYVCI